MKHFVLIYNYVEDYMARRDAYRAEVEVGRILAAGVLPEGPRALLICYADSSDAVRAFALGDPYYKAGLIASFEVSDWMVAAGVPQLVQPAAR